MLIGQTASVSWFNYLYLGEGFLAEVGGQLIQNMLSNGELLIVLRRQIRFDEDQRAAAIDWWITIDCLATSALLLPRFPFS
jgi:hypothetical protein